MNTLESLTEMVAVIKELRKPFKLLKRDQNLYLSHAEAWMVIALNESLQIKEKLKLKDYTFEIDVEVDEYIDVDPVKAINMMKDHVNESREFCQEIFESDNLSIVSNEDLRLNQHLLDCLRGLERTVYFLDEHLESIK